MHVSEFFFATRCRTDHNGGSHVCQLPRQGVCLGSIGVLEGRECSSFAPMPDDDNDNDGNTATKTQISRSRSLRGACGLKQQSGQPDCMADKPASPTQLVSKSESVSSATKKNPVYAKRFPWRSKRHTS